MKSEAARSRWARRAAAASGGLVFAASTPPTNFYLGIVFGLAAFAWASRGAEDETKREALFRGWLFGFATNLLALRFVPEVIVRFTELPRPLAWLALALLAAAQAFPWALGSLAARAASVHARVPPWLAFGVGIYVATFVPSVFPWTPAGGLARWPWLLQTAELVGERGTSLLVAFVAALGVAVAVAPSRRQAGVHAGLAATIVASVLVHGQVRRSTIARAEPSAPHARVALVQPGFDAYARWDPSRASSMVDRLAALTRSAESRDVALTVWPESAYPFTLAHATRRSPLGPRAVLQPGVHGPVLTGAYMAGAPGVGYNATFLARPDGTLSPPYDKRHLLWFGETVPLADQFPWLRRVFARGTGLAPGSETVLFVAGPIRATVLNCYEDTLPAAGREAMHPTNASAPNLLVNVTNDAWFEGSAEGELHLRLAVLRAIETRRDIVRAVNLGPTSWVDARGDVRAVYDASLPHVLVVEPALREDAPSLYVRLGDAPLVVLLAAALASHAATARRRRAQNAAGATS